jgi:hypothetical protein
MPVIPHEPKAPAHHALPGEKAEVRKHGILQEAIPIDSPEYARAAVITVLFAQAPNSPFLQGTDIAAILVPVPEMWAEIFHGVYIFTPPNRAGMLTH